MKESEDKKMIKTLRKLLKELHIDANAFYSKLSERRHISMWTYPKEKIKDSWRLDDLYERIMTAQTLGWDVVIDADEKGLHVRYAEKLPTYRPNSFY